MALAGWPPAAAWAATPGDLLLVLGARVALRRALQPAPVSRADYETLKARLDRAD
ncbi:tail assembly chaperone [Zavarzinia compransoris]|nr:tail assembly chaperone [Zavarzinia compransoris]